ncbi:hypothetical protein [Erythrobacter tepidarius]|uniref:hypothetical protein n=1 Tax=Erythrobacter tepidarius TaxID=60454 RepID=UPI001B809AA7|nr:hypothetical protein [Erythrobacter tepidarius]
MNMQSSAMIALLAAQQAGEAAPPQAAPPAPRHLFGPVIDFLCLGGSSLLLLPLIFLLPEAELKAPLATAMMLLTNLVNHPHFAHSYQIFYRGYARKAFTPALGRAMQVRYLVAGLVVPLLLAAFLVHGALAADTRLLGYAGNLMALAVGWHYAKQGYGMLMVDAALKRRFLDERTKKILLANCYAVWLAAWVGINLAVQQENLWGLAYYSFALPQPLFFLTSAAACLTTALSVWTLAMHWRGKGTLPVTGVVAYGVSLYLWLAFLRVNPLWVLVVPALHSLQYLTVVWRYQLNYEKARLANVAYRKGNLLRALFGPSPVGQMIAFVATGALLGFLAFWAIPLVAESIVPYDRQAITGFLFLFTFWIFINIHHYFLDSVMWRRENPDTRLYLFG